MIEITLGKFYTRNKTARYIFPIIESYSKEFLYQFQQTSKGLLATAIGDIKYDDAKGTKTQYALFMLYDINGAFDVNAKQHAEPILGRTKFNEYLKFLRTYTHYLDDYYFRSFTEVPSFRHSHLCCVVVKIPSKYHKAYDNFLKSAYSKMYTPEDLRNLAIFADFPDKRPNPIWSVLTKDKEYRQVFERNVNERFNTNVIIEDDRELDFPLKTEDEWFNFS